MEWNSKQKSQKVVADSSFAYALRPCMDVIERRAYLGSLRLLTCCETQEQKEAVLKSRKHGPSFKVKSLVKN